MQIHIIIYIEVIGCKVNVIIQIEMLGIRVKVWCTQGNVIL